MWTEIFATKVMDLSSTLDFNLKLNDEANYSLSQDEAKVKSSWHTKFYILLESLNKCKQPRNTKRTD